MFILLIAIFWCFILLLICFQFCPSIFYFIWIFIQFWSSFFFIDILLSFSSFSNLIIRYLIIRPWVLLFVLLIFFCEFILKSLITGCGLVELTRVDSKFFFLNIFLWNWFLVLFHHLTLNYWYFVIFLIFFLLGYLECCLVNLTWVNLRFFSVFFFKFNLGLFLNLIFF